MKHFCYLLLSLSMTLGLANPAVPPDPTQEILRKQIDWLENHTNDPLALKNYCETHFPSWLGSVQKALPEAKFLVGVCFYSGFGVKKADKKVGLKWCRDAADKGCLAAMNFLADHFLDSSKPDTETGQAWLMKSAEGGYSPAMFKLGLRYDHGFILGKDNTKALAWYRKAAAKGNRDAMCSLGICFEQGRGVKASPKTAINWYRKAAQLGHAEASYRLAMSYIAGKTVDKNLERAISWLKPAAKKRYVPAMYVLGKCYATGQGVKKDVILGLDWYRKAAILGSHDAMYSVALHYMSGEGVPQDNVRSAKWLVKAVKAGNPKAKDLLESIQNQK